MDDDDLALALSMQQSFDEENLIDNNNDGDTKERSVVLSDAALAAQLQRELNRADVFDLLPKQSSHKSDEESSSSNFSLVSTELDLLDPTPDLHALFVAFDKQFFQQKLQCCEVRWAARMTLCAGVCSYQRRSGYCSIRLSVPLLKFRPRKDLVETLLHEMIHAFLFVTDGDTDRDGHGPQFHSHMYRINRAAGTNITVYHTFHDEVEHHRQHWWQCDGPCRLRPPFMGMVKRAMNRAPGPNDTWYAQHQATCGGTFTKIKEPPGYGQKKSSKRKGSDAPGTSSSQDIRKFIRNDNNESKGKSKVPPKTFSTSSSSSSQSSSQVSGFVGDSTNKGKGSKKGGGRQSTITRGGSGAITLSSPSSRVSDNSSQGHVIANPLSGQSTSSSLSGLEGFILGGLVEVDEEGLTPRERVRRAWGQSSAQTNSNSKPESVPSDDKAVCPVCSMEVDANTINAHLDECLTLSAFKNSRVHEGSNVLDHQECPTVFGLVIAKFSWSHIIFCVASGIVLGLIWIKLIERYDEEKLKLSQPIKY